MLKKVKRALRKALFRCGLDVKKASGPAHLLTQTMEGALLRAAHRKHHLNTFIDVGAAEGLWSLQAMKIWPDSIFTLIEPLNERKQCLQALSTKYGNFRIVNAAAGSRIGELELFVQSDLDSTGVSDNGNGGCKRVVPVTTIDSIVVALNLKPPYCIKLDTHGFELPIIAGATNTLKHTEVLIIECYGFKIAPGSLLFSELCESVSKNDFRLVDIVDVKLRAHDFAFWQCDAVFIRKHYPIFNVNTFYI